MESILLEKNKWKIVYKTDSLYLVGIGESKPLTYEYRPIGEKLSAIPGDIFDSSQIYILNGELGCREGI